MSESALISLIKQLRSTNPTQFYDFSHEYKANHTRINGSIRIENRKTNDHRAYLGCSNYIDFSIKLYTGVYWIVIGGNKNKRDCDKYRNQLVELFNSILNEVGYKQKEKTN